MKFIFCVTLDLSDNLTEMRIVKNSIVKQLTQTRRNPLKDLTVLSEMRIVKN